MALLGLVALATSAWGVLALWYFDHAPSPVRFVLALTFALFSAGMFGGFLSARWRRRALGVYGLVFALLTGSWLAIEPSNDRDWQTDVAVLPYATFDGDRVTVHNIRNFDYRTEEDFTPAYYDRTFDLKELDGVDLVASYWMGPHIAHTFLSFRFAGKDHVAISIETRKERGESYSSLRGFFRQYELYYVVADERDVIRVRTNYRRDPPEEVHLYPLRGTADMGRRVFLDYMNGMNALVRHASFYNTLTTNCTTTIWTHAHVNPGRLPFSWKILASGHLPELLYETERIDTTLPFAELQRESVINALARRADQDRAFSRRIRAAPLFAAS